MLCTYGSSEYAQAFSRIGSLHSNVYIVNEELKIKDIEFENENEKNIFKTVSISFNDNPVKAKKGLIVGPEYKTWVENQLKSKSLINEIS